MTTLLTAFVPVPLKKQTISLFVCPLLLSRQQPGRRTRRERDTFKKKKRKWWVIDGGSQCLIWLSRGREAWSRCPWGRLCLGIIPEGAGFTLLAREDKHSLHMLREHDKGIASLNYIYKKRSPAIGAAKKRLYQVNWETPSIPFLQP